CSPGSELAYALIPQELEVVLDAATLYMKATNATVSPVYQHAFARVMQKHSALQEYLDGINNIYQSCAYYTFKRAQELQLSPTLPVAGVSIQVDFSAYKEALFSIGIKTSDELAMFLLKNYRLSLSPGEQFSIPGTDLIMRISCTDFDGQRAFDGAEKVADLDRDYVERYCSRIVRGLDALEKFIESIR
ncbi:MAG: hypothetical protein KDD62_14840, partial [Bdellovibrionales bacterium]|nr:hypothetical protein [Bdellovibrionales bacterium]